MSRRSSGVAAPVVEAFRRQVATMAGSAMYRHLAEVILDDIAADGPTVRVLREADPSIDPWAHALPLRFLGGVHRLVLEGRVPDLARHYGSVGGAFDPAAPGTIGADFVAAVDLHRDALVAALERRVQTNEVGRCALLVGGYHEIVRRCALPLRVLEVGTSAGLNLRWDRYWYDTGTTTFGDPGSRVRFEGVWEGAAPDLDRAALVAQRAGCDLQPVDPTTDDGRLTLLSFVWPDQRDRVDRLRAAIDLAAAVPVDVVAADAGEWVEAQLAAPCAGVSTVVVHSIVLQYLPRESRVRMRDAVRAAGAHASASSTVHWLRMEPAGPVADLRLTSWTGARHDGADEVLATAGFHGTPVTWGQPSGESG